MTSRSAAEATAHSFLPAAYQQGDSSSVSTSRDGKTLDRGRLYLHRP